jgi:hypothetical protein
VIGVFAGVATLLYISAIRFSEYAIPFLALYLIVLASRLATRKKLAPLKVVAFVVGISAGSWMSMRSAAEVVRFNHARYGFASIDDMRAFRQALPEGAKVAATWDFTPFYYFVQPKARYLNVLDPIFMWIPHQQAFDVLEKAFTGSVVDIPSVLIGQLDSDYIAYHQGIFPQLGERIARDPRLVPVAGSGGHSLARIDKTSSHGFIADWRILWSDDSTFESYTAKRAARAVPDTTLSLSPVGYVTPVRTSGAPSRCWWAYRNVSSLSGNRLTFGSAGPARVFVDGELVYATTEGHAGLIDAVRLDVKLAARREQEWAVWSCSHSVYGSGFYLRMQ